MTTPAIWSLRRKGSLIIGRGLVCFWFPQRWHRILLILRIPGRQYTYPLSSLF